MTLLRSIIFSTAIFLLLSFTDDRKIKANFDTETYELRLDDTVIVKFHKVSHFVNTYGKPDTILIGKDGISQTHLYERYGISLDVRYGSIRGVNLSFNNEKDTNYTKSPFTGELEIGSDIINAASTVNTFKSMGGFFDCSRAGACFSKLFGEAVTVFVIFEKTGKKRMQVVSFIING